MTRDLKGLDKVRGIVGTTVTKNIRKVLSVVLQGHHYKVVVVNQSPHILHKIVQLLVGTVLLEVQ